MVDKPVNAIKHAEGLLKLQMDGFAEKVGKLDIRKYGVSHLGKKALSDIYNELGENGLIEFTRWAVHPVSGFLPQFAKAKPLPLPIQDILERTVKEVNAEIDKMAKDKKQLAGLQKKAESLSPIDRRAFLRIGESSAAFAAGWATMGAIFAAIVKNPLSKSSSDSSQIAEKSYATLVAKDALMGAIVGGALQTGIELGIAKYSHAFPSVINPRPLHMSVDQGAIDAAETLKDFLTPENHQAIKR